MRASGRTTATRVSVMDGRGVHQEADDSTLMQQWKGSGLFGESHRKVERPQNYGMTAVPLPPNKGGGSGSDPLTSDGWGAEAFMGYMGGNRSQPYITHVDDRRYRPREMKAGESFQYDDQGQGTYVARGATHVIGGGYGDQATQRFASLRHVLKQRQSFPQKQSSGQQGGGQQQGQQQQQYKHEGDSPTAEVKVGNAEIDLLVKGKTLVKLTDGQIDLIINDTVMARLTADGLVICCKVWLGTDGPTDKPTNLVDDVDDNPSKRTYVKVA